MKLSANVTQGVDRAPNRSLFNALGYTQEELDRPLVGIVSSYNEIVPGHMNIDKIVEAVKQGVLWTAIRFIYFVDDDNCFLAQSQCFL